jgi:hypothetical protein
MFFAEQTHRSVLSAFLDAFSARLRASTGAARCATLNRQSSNKFRGADQSGGRISYVWDKMLKADS